MAYENTTHDQHFVSQAEQRLNAINPTAQNRNQKIYRFEISDRENVILGPQAATAVKISSSLMARDLFSFDVSGGLRLNLERQFQAYEAGIVKHSLSLLRKLESRDRSDLKSDLLSLFVCKFIGFLRNPYCIAKVLNTIGMVADFALTTDGSATVQAAIAGGNRPHRDWLCRSFDVSTDMYDRWLRALFMMVAPGDTGQPNLLEGTLKRLFETQFVTVYLHHYTQAHAEETCVLSDRGHVTSIQETALFALDFNVSRSAFVTFAFADIDAYVPEGTPAEYVDALKQQRRVTVHYLENDLAALARYNANAAFQCAKAVFAARPSARISTEKAR